jgi:hypothetical protein
MKHVTRDEILPIGEYEAVRGPFRARVIEEKKRRRVHVGEFLTFTIENHDSVLLQIQEMLRTERITSEPGIQHEIDTYNELVPGPNEISITLFVEIPEKEVRDRKLVELVGLEDAVAFVVDGEAFPSTPGSSRAEDKTRTTAVHYLKFVLSDEAKAKIVSKKASVAFRVDHPAHRTSADLPASVVAALAADFG